MEFPSVQSPVLSVHEATVERKKLSFNRKKPPSEPGRAPSASTSWGLRGQERGDNKHRNTRPEIPAGREKHKLMTTMMYKMSYEEIKGGKKRAK